MMDSPLALQKETSRLERLFRELDTNQDGRIDPEELSQGLRSMGYSHVTSEQLTRFFEQCDANQSGDLNLAEFVDYLSRHEEQLHFIFNSLDENRDGRLCVEEIAKAFKKMGIVISLEEAALLKKRINRDDNSLDISFEEWRSFLLFHPSSELYDIIESWRHNTIIDYGEDIGVPDDFSDADLLTGMWWRHLVAGGVAGAVSRTCTAPLDRLKIFLQVHGGRKSLTIRNTVSYMWKEGGLSGLWRGNGVNVIKIAPESAIKFGSFDLIKRVIRGDADRDLYIHERFLAGSLAGATAQSVIYPLEVMKTRLALRKTDEFKGIVDCAQKLFRSDGIGVFYRGYIPNLLGILPYAGIDLAVYETLKRKYLSSHMSDGTTPPAMSLLAFGTFSSCCGQVAAYPLALVRTKLQSQAGLQLQLPQEQTHAVGLFKYILRTEGFTGLYRGIIPNFCKVCPAVSISYYVYERTREYLGVEMT